MTFTSIFCSCDIRGQQVCLNHRLFSERVFTLNHPCLIRVKSATLNIMTEKRKHDDAFASTPGAKTIVPIHIQPQKKPREQSTPAVERDYTTSQIRAFINGVSKIQDWTSNNILKKHIQMIYWFDVENLSKDECAKRYPNKQGQPCSMTNIFKVYNTYAPRFYAEKGLEYVPLGKRGSARAASVVRKKRKDKTTKKVRRNSLDIRFEGLFEKLPRPALPSSRVQIWDEKPTQPCLRHATSNLTEDSQNSDDDKIVFLSSSGSTTHGSPTGLEIPRAHLLRHCSSIRDALLGSPRINTITHGPEISADTICRFAACIAETAQSRLPESITTAYGTFEQEWSMADLENLYVLAVTLGAAAVCDLVIDRWFEELRQPEPRIVIDEFGEVQYFDILEFGPELLSFLWANDTKGVAFFSNVLLSHGPAGLERMKTTHLANWHEGVKKVLIRAMEEGGVMDLFSASPSTVCKEFHHHSPQQFKNCVPEKPSGEMSKATAVPTMPARPTLNSSRPRYDDFEEDTSHTLHLTIPHFPHTHNKYPRISATELDPIYQLAAYGTDRLRDLRNSHLDNRIHYANEKFNARHDTEDACREKLLMCREKLALFEGQRIRVSDDEVEKAVAEQERVYGEDGSETQDEDSDVEMENAEESEEEEFEDV